jgi:hypothetical protein
MITHPRWLRNTRTLDGLACAALVSGYADAIASMENANGKNK